MEIGFSPHLNHSPEAPVTVSQMRPSVGWVWVLFPWLKQWMCFSQLLSQLHHPPPNSCRTCPTAEAKGTGQGRRATGAVQYRSLQNSLPHSHHVLNVLRVTDFISKFYEPSGLEICSGHKTFFFVCCAICPGLWKLQILQKKNECTMCTPAV